MTMILLLTASFIGLISLSKLFHTVAYFQSLANTANTDCAALADSGILPITNSHFIPPRDYMCFAAYASAVTLLRARLNSGTIRQVNPTYIRPINVALLPANNQNMMWMRNNPMRIHGHEELAVEATDSAAGPNNFYTLLWLESRYDAPPQGDIYNIRLTGTTTLTANAWTAAAMTLETGLPAGVYDVLNMYAFGTTLVCFRLIFDSQFERPGIIGHVDGTARNPYITDFGAYGKFGTFKTYSLPRFEALANAADTAEEAYLMVIKQPGVAA